MLPSGSAIQAVRQPGMNASKSIGPPVIFASAPISASLASTSSTLNARWRQPGYSGPGRPRAGAGFGWRRLEQLQVERPGLQEDDLVAAAERGDPRPAEAEMLRVEALRGGHVRADHAHVMDLDRRHGAPPPCLSAMQLSRARRGGPPMTPIWVSSADHVGPVPALDDLAVGDLEHRDLGEVDRLAGRRDRARRRDHRRCACPRWRRRPPTMSPSAISISMSTLRSGKAARNIPAIILTPAGPGRQPGCARALVSRQRTARRQTSSFCWFQTSSMTRWKMALLSSVDIGVLLGRGQVGGRWGPRGRSGRLGRRLDLGHQPERVELLPARDDLRPAEAEDRAAGPGDLACPDGGDPVEVALVRPRQRPRDEDVVALADQLVDLEPQVRERASGTSRSVP